MRTLVFCFLRWCLNGLCMCFQSESYQEDIYPMTPGNKPALTAEEWLSGMNKSQERFIVVCVCWFRGGTCIHVSLFSSRPSVDVSEAWKSSSRGKFRDKQSTGNFSGHSPVWHQTGDATAVLHSGQTRNQRQQRGQQTYGRRQEPVGR